MVSTGVGGAITSTLRFTETETVSLSFKVALTETLPLDPKNVLPIGSVGEPEVVALLEYLKLSRFSNQTSLVTASVGAPIASDSFGEITDEAGGGSVL